MIKVNRIFEKRSVVFILSVTWLLYAILYHMLKQYGGTNLYVGLLAFVGEIGVEFCIIGLLFSLWRKTVLREKSIFALFGISFLFLLMSDTIFNFVVNIYGITVFSDVLDSFINIPFIVFLILQLIIWSSFFIRAIVEQKNKNAFLLSIPIVITILIVFMMFLRGNSIGDAPWFSLLGLYTILEIVLQLLNFIFVTMALCISQDKQIRFVGIGFLLIIGSASIEQLNTVMMILKPLSVIETLWVLGLLFMAFGFYNILQNGDIKTRKWFGNL